MTNVFKSGATALITGGASGIGFAFARTCRSKGMNLILADINSEHLEAACSRLNATESANKSARIETCAMDVSHQDEWQKVKDLMDSKLGGAPSVLMLNAGAAPQPREGTSPWTDPDHHARTYQINVFGVLNGIATFLPSMQAKTDSPGTIIVTGSKQGITNPPGRPAYNASKATIKHLTEHLAHDMRAQSPHIAVHLLVPGFVYTGLAGNAGPVDDSEAQAQKPAGAWLGSTLVEYALQKIDEGKFYIICPDDDVTEALDKARMTYQVGDIIEGRSALSRWDPKFKDSAAAWISADAKRREEEGSS